MQAPPCQRQKVRVFLLTQGSYMLLVSLMSFSITSKKFLGLLKNSVAKTRILKHLSKFQLGTRSVDCRMLRIPQTRSLPRKVSPFTALLRSCGIVRKRSRKRNTCLFKPLTLSPRTGASKQDSVVRMRKESQGMEA